MPSSPRARLPLLAAAVLLASMSVPMVSSADTYPGACREISEMDADASGRAVALQVLVGGIPVVMGEEAAAYQDGPGRSNSTRDFLSLALPGDEDPIVRAELLKSRVDLDVDASPLESEAFTQSTLVHLDVLDGLVTADTVKAWAWARSDVRSARTYSHESQIQGLTVEGISITDIAPGLEVPLATLLPGSFVKVYDREEHSRFPGNGSILYVANVTVTMIHVHVEGLPGVGDIDVIVSQAQAYAQTPTPWCGGMQMAEAGAYVSRIRAFDEPSILVGHQHVGPTGGVARQVYAAQNVTAGSLILETANAETRATADVELGSHSESRAVEKLHGLCIKVGEDDCFVSATMIRAESNSRADADEAISWGHVTIVDLKVAGIDVCADILGMPDDNDKTAGDADATEPNVCKPAKNTVIDLGVAKVTLNERQREFEPGHTGYYVRAVRVDIPDVGTVIVGRAYSAADYLVIDA